MPGIGAQSKGRVDLKSTNGVNQQNHQNVPNSTSILLKLNDIVHGKDFLIQQIGMSTENYAIMLVRKYKICQEYALLTGDAASPLGVSVFHTCAAVFEGIYAVVQVVSTPALCLVVECGCGSWPLLAALWRTCAGFGADFAGPLLGKTAHMAMC